MKEFTKEELLANFGKNLARCRTAKNMTQMDVAVAIDSYPGYISRLENGKAEPGLFMIISLADALHVTTTELLH